MPELHDQLEDLLREHNDLWPHDLAAAILAAGWRPPARVITSAEELDALPDRTIIRSGYDTAVQKSDDVWEFPNYVGQYTSDAIDLPATVLWQPEEGGDV